MDLPSFNLAFIEGLGGPEVMLVLVIVLVLFGGDKLPGFAKGLGKSIREFKKAAAGVEEEFRRALEEDEKKSTPPPPTTFPPYPPAPPPSTVAQIEPPVPHQDGAPTTSVEPPAPPVPPAPNVTPPPAGHGDNLP